MPNLLSLLENGLFALGQVLRFPIFALLWVCVIAVLFMAGRCVVDFVMRRRERYGFNLDAWLAGGSVLDAAETRRRRLPSSLRRLLQDVEKQRTDDTLGGGGLEHLVLEQEERVRRSLTAPRMLVRVGPSLGLIGTLIPMGVSLAAMAGGNLEAMAGQMVIAFTSTIIGLSTGTVAYVVATVRLNWVNEAIREQRFLAERISSELTRHPEFAREN
ncbi:MAG: MotA/TolQ/ExbB proton channel family protein [Acidobacteriota bacterium]